MFVTDLDSIQHYLSSAIGFITVPHKEIGYENVELTEKYTTAMQQYLPFSYTTKQRNGNCISIIPDIKPYKCVVCTRDHDS